MLPFPLVAYDLTRPYLVIPKLIVQPTWGGDYIVKAKNWAAKSEFKLPKIGQAYELFSGSNLSLLTHSEEPDFTGELTDSKAVAIKTYPPHSVALAELISQSAQNLLGNETAKQFGPQMYLLIKFTQALGNSFQLHIKDGTKHPKWKSKPESWYYFEPGIITLGAVAGVDWAAYQKAVTDLNNQILAIGKQVQTGRLEYAKAQSEIKELITSYNPWQYVNVLHTQKDALIDLSPCGLHHSWEEDIQKYPLGNIVYELQLDVFDEEATIRCFDKGKMNKDGATRPLQIEEYFQFIDRSPGANDPNSYIKSTLPITDSENYTLNRLLHTKYYTLDKLDLTTSYAAYTEVIDHFRHVFVKSGKVDVATGSQTVTVASGHSCLVPAGAKEYTVKNSADSSVVLISY